MSGIKSNEEMQKAADDVFNAIEDFSVAEFCAVIGYVVAVIAKHYHEDGEGTKEERVQRSNYLAKKIGTIAVLGLEREEEEPGKPHIIVTPPSTNSQ